jgi:hypothetical protein
MGAAAYLEARLAGDVDPAQGPCQIEPHLLHHHLNVPEPHTLKTKDLTAQATQRRH